LHCRASLRRHRGFFAVVSETTKIEWTTIRSSLDVTMIHQEDASNIDVRLEVTDDPKQRLPHYVLPDHLRGTNWRIDLGGTPYEVWLRGYSPPISDFLTLARQPMLPDWAAKEVARYLDVPEVRDRMVRALRRLDIEPKDNELEEAMTRAFIGRKLTLVRHIAKVYDPSKIKGLQPEEPSPFGRVGHPPLKPNPPPENGPTWFELRLLDEIGEPLANVMVRLRVGSVAQSIKTDADGLARMESKDGLSFGTGQIDDVRSVRDILGERWAGVRPQQPLENAADRTFVTCPNGSNTGFPTCQLVKQTTHTVVVRPDISLVRCSGMIFEPNKFFPIPNLEVSKLQPLVDQNPKGTLLVVGHAESAGGTEGHVSLSLERARTIAAWLRRDVDAWLRNYGSTVAEERRWGKMQDQFMLGEILRRTPDAPTPGRERVRWFQRSRGLAVDGIIGDETRKTLIVETMAHSGLVVPNAMAVEVLGCGDTFPMEEATSEDRPIELLFFNDGLGILPRPSGPTSVEEYPEWIRRARDVRVIAGGRPSPKPASTLTVSGTRFAFDSAFPIPSVTAPLRLAVETLEDEPDRRITIFGHTDASGSADVNKRLSDRRAKAFVALLTSDLAMFDEIAASEGWGLAVYQAMLRSLGPNPGPIDGQYGKLTRKAILGFQDEYSRGVFHRDSNLPARSSSLALSGELDEPTKAALRDAYVANLGGAISPTRLLGPGHAGCSEFNPIGANAREHRRITLALFAGEQAPASTDFPCVEGEASACPLDGTNSRRCPFYRDVVDEPDDASFAGEDLPFFDFQWLKGSDTRTHLSAITVLPDDSDVTFTVYRSREQPFPTVPDAGRGTAPPEPGELEVEIAGTVKGGIAYAIWEHATAASPFAIARWLPDLDVEFELTEDDSNEPMGDAEGTSRALLATSGFSPPLFRVTSGNLWGLSSPPGRRLNRVYFDDEPGDRGIALRNDGFVIGFGAARGAVRATDDILVLSLAARDTALNGASPSTYRGAPS